MARHALFVALGLGATVIAGALQSGCEGNDGGGASSGTFMGPDSGFGSETGTSSGGPTGDGAAGDGGQQGDAAIDESTAPVALVNMTTGAMHGAASADGSAIIIGVVGSVINVSLYEPATGWSVGAALPTLTTTTSIRGNTAVAMDGKGDAFVAWTTTTADNHNGFYVARYDHATKTWGAAQQPDPYVENFGDNVAIAANASGDVLANAAHAGATLAHDFVMSHYDAASAAWSQETVIALGNDKYTDGPEVQLMDNGKAVALAYPRPVATRDATGAWTVAPDVTATVLPIYAAMNETGDVLVAAQDFDNVVYGIRYDAATTTWNSPLALSSTSSDDSYGGCQASAGIQANGDGVVIRCFDGDTKRTQESYTYAKATDTWSPVTVLAEAGEGPGHVTYAFDKAGDGIAIYQDFATIFNPPASPAVINTFTAGVWSPESAGLGGNINSDYTPAAFLAPTGRGFAVWGEGTALHAKKVR